MDIIKLKTNFQSYYKNNQSKPRYYFSPGRVNLIGEHIDYSGGTVLPVAISLGIYGIASLNQSKVINLYSDNHQLFGKINLDNLVELKNYNKNDGWLGYPKGIVYYFLNQGIKIEGFDLYMHSTLPEESGLSSSAAFELLISVILNDFFNNNQLTNKELALISQKIENDYIGVNCGIMDQFAVAMGKRNQAIVLNTSNLDYSFVPIDFKEYSLLIINSNKKRILSESKYNERRNESEIALKQIRQKHDIQFLTQGNIEWIYECVDDPIIQKRALHAITENNRVNEAIKALKNNHIIKFGKLLKESHLSLRNNYEVTGRELDVIFDFCLNYEYCIGARMTGAGFAGASIALIKKEYIDHFSDKIKQVYLTKTNLSLEIFKTEIVDGTGIINQK